MSCVFNSARSRIRLIWTAVGWRISSRSREKEYLGTNRIAVPCRRDVSLSDDRLRCGSVLYAKLDSVGAVIATRRRGFPALLPVRQRPMVFNPVGLILARPGRHGGQQKFQWLVRQAAELEVGPGGNG